MELRGTVAESADMSEEERRLCKLSDIHQQLRDILHGLMFSIQLMSGDSPSVNCA